MTSSHRNALRPQLKAGLDEMGLVVTDVQVDQLLDFQELLQKWNRVYNLTAVRDPQEMLTHHLLDSLAAVAPLRRHAAAFMQAPAHGSPDAPAPFRLLDVGSGGGLPGVVFAICCPDVDVSCVDAVGKKAAFVQQVAVSLRLSNLHGVHARVETLQAEFDLISCRAFASLPDFVAWSRSALAAAHGVWLAMKGKLPSEEMAALPVDVEVFHVEQLHVPGLAAERCAVWMRPSLNG